MATTTRKTKPEAEPSLSTPEAAKLLGLTGDQFRKLAERLSIEPVGYYTNSHYRSGPECPLWPEARVQALVGGKDVAEVLDRSRRLAEARAAAPEKRRARLRRRHPDARQAVPVAAEALFNLNRYAKHKRCSYDHRDEIYELKTQFIRLLCALGLAVAVKKHVTDRPGKVCYCDFGDDGVCGKCDDTGWFVPPHQEVLVAFRFDIDGKTYCWHQPEDLVTWSYQVTEGVENWEGERVEKPVAMPPSKFADAKAIIRHVVESLEPEPMGRAGAVVTEQAV